MERYKPYITTHLIDYQFPLNTCLSSPGLSDSGPRRIKTNQPLLSLMFLSAYHNDKENKYYHKIIKSCLMFIK